MEDTENLYSFIYISLYIHILLHINHENDTDTDNRLNNVESFVDRIHMFFGL